MDEFVSTELPLTVHVGLPRTGTTCLQRQIFAKHSDIRYLGKHCTSREARLNSLKALRAVAHLSDAEYEDSRASVSSCWSDLLGSAKLVRPSQTAVTISFEDLYHPGSRDPITVMTRLRNVFGPGFRVLVSIRNQFRWIESLYLCSFREFTVKGGQANFGDWSADERKKEWNAFACCDYWPMIKSLAGIVGRESIFVAPMELLIKDSKAALQKDLSVFMRVGVEETLRLFNDAVVENEGIGEMDYVLGRSQHLAAEALPGIQKKVLSYLLARIREQTSASPMKARIPGDVREYFSIEERLAIARGNKGLSDYTGLDLEQLGYPI